VIKHEVDERHGVEKVVFDISWNHWFQEKHIRRHS
jgi:hypothetical protein